MANESKGKFKCQYPKRNFENYIESKMDRNLSSSSSLLRKQESTYLNLFWIAACSGMTLFIFIVRR